MEESRCRVGTTEEEEIVYYEVTEMLQQATQRSCGCPHSWRWLRPGCMGPWEIRSRGRCPCLWQGTRTRWSLRFFSTQTVPCLCFFPNHAQLLPDKSGVCMVWHCTGKYANHWTPGMRRCFGLVCLQFISLGIISETSVFHSVSWKIIELNTSW